MEKERGKERKDEVAVVQTEHCSTSNFQIIYSSLSSTIVST